MGAPKQKWTTAEEAALRAGVKKHGLGKWRAIQKDPEFTFLLATRSNVDLKDKWRNMNIGLPGYVSREKSIKSLSKQRALKGSEEPLSPLPLAILPGELSAEDSLGLGDALVSSDSPKEAKSLGPRYTDMVIDAIVDLNSPSGASSSDIASSIEANNLVPANFRRLLRVKLKDMVKDGSLVKVRDNYKVNNGSEEVDEGNQSGETIVVAKRKMRGVVKSSRGFDTSDDKRFRDESVSDLTIRPPSKQYVKGLRGDRSMEKAFLDVDYARLKLKTAEEAARAAALAMAEAEAAAAAAEKAARKARAAEAEAEAAEIAAEVAALAARPPKKVNEQPCKRLKAKVSTRPLEDMVDGSKLPFKGRDTLMVELAKRIGVYFDAFSDGRIKREDMLFVVFEGLAGVGKTRCLLETPKHVEKVVKPSSALAKLYACRAVYSVYITFNGTGVGGRKPHVFHSAFETIIHSRGPLNAGGCFMQACMISEIMYGQPWGELPPEYQQEIITEDVSSALMNMSTHIRNSKFSESQDLALYVLIDESQMLAQSIMRIGHDGLEFVKGMFLWIFEVMTGQCLGKQCKLGLIPLIAGTVVPAVGRWGVSDWLPYCTVLPPLDKDSAADVLRELIDDGRFSEIMKGLVVLLEDCSYLPRLISFIYGAWVGVLKVPMSGKDFVHHLRETVFIQTKPWVDTLISQCNRAVLQRMVRLCLTGAVMKEPQEVEKTECMKGYVYAERAQDGWKYHSPRLLVRSLAEELGIRARSVPLRPVAAKGSHLEDAFVDTFYALLCIYEGMQIPVAKLFVGAVGKQSILDMKVDIHHPVAQVDEKHQFFNPRQGRFHHEGDSFCIGANECSYYLPPCTGREKPSLGVLFRCHRNAAVTDARLFLCDENGDFYEFWIQLKGGKDPMSQGDVAKCCQAAFDPKFKVDGRRKVYVLCTTGGFSFDESNITEDVLLMNLVHFLPDFMRLSPEE